MNNFTLIFLSALLLSLGLKLWLAGRQIRHVRACRDQVPRAFRQRITLEMHQLAADYTIARTRFGLAALLLNTLLLLGWTLGGGLNIVDQFWQSVDLPAISTGIAVILSVLLLASLLELPLSLYQTFILEQRFGFNKTTPAVFISDLIREGLLTLLIAPPLLLLILWLMPSSGQGAAPSPVGSLWWLDVWLVWLGFSLLMLWAYPAVIAPLFNRFSPLADEALQQRIMKLLQRTGFTADGIFVMDGSRRSAHGNAYFSGLGSHKRIVFFDTLINRLNADEIEAVLAHELGHFKHRHIHKHLAATALGSLLGAGLLAWLITQPGFFSGLGVVQASPHLALLLLLLISPVFSFFVRPLIMGYARRHEFEADDYAAEQSDAAHLISALVKLYQDNAATLTPDPCYSLIYDSHPPATIRIAHLATRTRG